MKTPPSPARNNGGVRIMNGGKSTGIPATKAREPPIVRVLFHTAAGKHPGASPALQGVLRLPPAKRCHRPIHRLGACMTKETLPTQEQCNEAFFASSKGEWDSMGGHPAIKALGKLDKATARIDNEIRANRAAPT